MAAQDSPLHILFFPAPAPGHLNPIADMAALFASRGVRCTILTTPVNAAIIRSAVDRANDDGTDCPAIDISVVPFPDVGLPPGVEHGKALISGINRDKFLEAVKLLQEPFHRFLADSRPDAVVSDTIYHWSTDAAAEHGVPRLAFHGSSMFARCCIDAMLRNNPLALGKTSPDDDDDDALVSLRGLLHRVELRRRQMMDPGKMPEQWASFQRGNAADQRSFGEVINTFHELEGDYAKHFQTTTTPGRHRRVWLVGPVALACKDMAGRGTSAPPPDGCLRWMDTKQPGSVVYVSFGTLTSFSPAELHQIARGLDLSGKNFLWAVAGTDSSDSEWMPQGFAELLAPGPGEGRGFIIRGWAPQMLVLNHPAIGGFVTHCGWNSTLEAISAGVPMVTWPRYADQFYNEKLVVQVLKVGVSVGAKDYASADQTHEVIAGEVIAESIGRLMGCSAIQKKAKHLGVAARNAVENGGSSYHDVGRLMDELMARRRRHLRSGL